MVLFLVDDTPVLAPLALDNTYLHPYSDPHDPNALSISVPNDDLPQELHRPTAARATS